MGGETRHRYQFGGFVLDVSEHRLSREGQEIPLRPKSFETLLYLVRNHGHLVTKDSILDAVWADANVTEGVLTQSIWEIREALRNDSEELTFVATIPKVGYKFVAPVREEHAPASVEIEKSPQRRPRIGARIIVAAAVILLIVLFWKWDVFERPEPSVQADRWSIAVLPFKNYSEDPSHEYLGERVSDQITAQLVKLKDFKVISTLSAMRYKDSKKTAKEIAQELGVTNLLNGNVNRQGDEIRVTARLIDALKDEDIIWVGSFDNTGSPFFEFEIAQGVAKSLEAKLTPGFEQRPTVSAEIYEDLYLPGMHFLNRGGMYEDPELIKKGIGYLEEAVDQDPNFAEAWARLGTGLWILAGWKLKSPQSAQWIDRAEKALRRSIELDDSLALAHSSLGTLLNIHFADWASAEDEYMKALDLSPGHYRVRSSYALFLERMGRWEEAREQMKQAFQLSPVDLGANANLGLIYMDVGDAEAAIQACERALEFYPEIKDVHWYLALAHIVAEDYEAALQVLEDAIDHFGVDDPFLPYVGYVYALEGKESEARQILEEMISRVEANEIDMYASRPIRGITRIYTALGDKDSAFLWLSKIGKEQLIADMYRGPWFKPLHSDPRWTELRRRAGLEP